MEEGSQNIGGVPLKDNECKRMSDELRSLMRKHEEMEKRIGRSSSMDQLLSKTDLPYSNK